MTNFCPLDSVPEMSRIMPMPVRLIISLLGALCGGALGFGGVILLFALIRQDTGIGGGLLALLAALIGGCFSAVATFRRLGRGSKS